MIAEESVASLANKIIKLAMTKDYYFTDISITELHRINRMSYMEYFICKCNTINLVTGSRINKSLTSYLIRTNNSLHR